MSFYTDQRDNTVYPLLLQFGKAIELYQKTASTYDPVSGKYGIDTYTLIDTGIAVQTGYKAKEVDGKTIIRGDKKLIMLSDNDTELQVDDRIVMDSVTWNIVFIDEVKPAETRVLYKLQIRKG